MRSHNRADSTERYRSGHNGADSKSVWAQAHVGSNPTLSAKQGEARLHGGNAAASLTSKASDFILSTNRQQSEAEGFLSEIG